MGLAEKYKEIASNNQFKIEQELDEYRELAKEEYKKIIAEIERVSNEGKYNMNFNIQGKGHKLKQGLELLLRDDGFRVTKSSYAFYISWNQ